jgi:hypothetical protein
VEHLLFKCPLAEFVWALLVKLYDGMAIINLSQN